MTIIISPVSIVGTSGAYTFYNSTKNCNTGNQTNYTLLYLVRVYSGTEVTILVSLIETITQNVYL